MPGGVQLAVLEREQNGFFPVVLAEGDLHLQPGFVQAVLCQPAWPVGGVLLDAHGVNVVQEDIHLPDFSWGRVFTFRFRFLFIFLCRPDPALFQLVEAKIRFGGLKLHPPDVGGLEIEQVAVAVRVHAAGQLAVKILVDGKDMRPRGIFGVVTFPILVVTADQESMRTVRQRHLQAGLGTIEAVAGERAGDFLLYGFHQCSDQADDEIIGAGVVGPHGRTGQLPVVIGKLGHHNFSGLVVQLQPLCPVHVNGQGPLVAQVEQGLLQCRGVQRIQ